MRRLFLSFCLISLLGTSSLLAQESTPGCYDRTLSATGRTQVITTSAGTTVKISASYYTTGTPTGVSISVEVANQLAATQTPFNKIAAVTNTTGADMGSASGSYRYWYVNLVTLSGGTSPTVVFSFCFTTNISDVARYFTTPTFPNQAANTLFAGPGSGAAAAPTFRLGVLADLPFGTANQVLGTNSGATAQEHKTLAVGTTGTDFAIAHAANSITFNLPNASATARGVIAASGSQTLATNLTLTGNTLVKNLNAIRFADQFAGADAGVKIVGAIADLPSTGGTVILPSGNSSYAAKIGVDKSNVRLVGHGGHSGVDGIADSAATVLTYTGTGTGIEIGKDLGGGSFADIQGTILENFSLKVGSGVDGVTGLDSALWVKFRDLQLIGTSNTGTGIKPQNVSNAIGWTYERVHIRDFATGVEIRNGDGHHLFDCYLQWNTNGAIIGVTGASSLPADIRFEFLRTLPPATGTNTGIQILSGRNIHISADAEVNGVAGSRFLKIDGSVNNVPTGITLSNSRIKGNAPGTHAIEVSRVNGLVIENNRFEVFATKYLLNNATNVSNVFWKQQASVDNVTMEIPANTTGYRELVSSGDRSFSGKLSVGASTETSNTIAVQRAAVPQAKTVASLINVVFLGTNEAEASNPFGLVIREKGGATLADRFVDFQTTDFNLTTGGYLSLQPGVGNIAVGFSDATPDEKLTLASTAKVGWDDGIGTVDTNLYRSAANTLKTDDDFHVALNPSFLSGTAFTGTFDHAITAARTWTVPDASGTLALTTTIGTGGTDLSWSAAGGLSVPTVSATARGVLSTGADTIAGAKTFNSSVAIGAGTAITKHLSATASLDFGAVAANACSGLTITVTGAADGNTVALGVPNTLASTAGLSFTGFVSAADTVTARACNVATAASADPAAATVRADVWQH